MSPKDVVFTTKPFEYEAFVTTISDSKTVPSFEELRTKVLNQESRLHRIQAAQHSEQQSAFVSQTSAASDNRSSRSNYNGARNSNGRNKQLILRIALASPYSQVTISYFFSSSSSSMNKKAIMDQDPKGSFTPMYLTLSTRSS